MKFQKTIIFSIFCAMAFSVNTFVEAQTSEVKRVKSTICRMVSTGEIIGYSNDCVTGTGHCVDRT